MPTPSQLSKPRRVPRVLARFGRGSQPMPKRPGTEFDSADPEGLVRRLDESDCFCRDTKVGRMYHAKDASYREIVPRDSLHVTVRDGRTVATHVDRHSPLARRQTGGDCRYSPVRIAAHNLTGAARDLVRLARRDERRHEHERTLVDDHAVSEALIAKESDSADESWEGPAPSST
ncbi:hypothetical protein BH24ACT1_BH24ACT1_11430 [soil metagenome]